jgi:integrase
MESSRGPERERRVLGDLRQGMLAELQHHAYPWHVRSCEVVVMAYPEKRKGRLTGKWIAEVELPPVAGKRSRVRERFDQLKDAERWEALVKLGEAPRREGAERAEGPTWGEAVKQCLDAGGPKGKWRAGRDPHMHQRVDVCLKFLGPDTPLAAVTTVELDKLVTHLRKTRGVGDATINRYLAFVSGTLRWAVKRRMLPGMPDVPWQREDGRRLLWLTQEEEDALCSALVQHGWPDTALIVRVLVATGMRWGELARLKVSEIEDDWLRLWQTKSNRPRSVPIEPLLAKQLRELVATKGVPAHSTVRYQFKTALKSAGGNPALCIHSLRHTTATRHVEAGTPMNVVMELLGHSSIKTTMRYAHLNNNALAEAAKKVSQLAGEKPGKPGFRVVS